MLGTLRTVLGRGKRHSPHPASESASALLDDAAASLRSGDGATARDRLERARICLPSDPRVQHRCGRLLGEVGQLVEAEELLRGVLVHLPDEPSVMTDLANVLRLRGDPDSARDLYEHALCKDPTFVPALVNLGHMQLVSGAFSEAFALFQRTLDVDHDSPFALLHAGHAALRLGDAVCAEKYYSRALDTDGAAAAIGLACALQTQGRTDAALVRLESLVREFPAHLEALQMLGSLTLAAGRYEEAIRWLERAVDVAPDSAPTQANLGLAYARSGRSEEALDALELALHYEPNLVAAHVNFGVVYSDKKRWQDAEVAFRRAVELDPRHVQAARALARVLHQQYRLEEAEAQFQRALALDERSAESWTGLGMVTRELGRYDDARAAYERALECDPEFLEALIALGIVALDLHDVTRAMECFDQARGVNALDESATWHITCARLLCGRWEQAWEFYGARRHSAEAVARPFPFPEWDGSELLGKTLLVYAEQGLGDEIMFASCYNELQSSVGHLVIECSRKLEPLFRRSFPAATVFGGSQAAAPAWLESAPKIDVQSAGGTVASMLRRSNESFPEHAGYLHADPIRVAHWRARLEELGHGPKIGISWRGGSTKTRTRLRSTSLDDWHPLFEIPAAQFISLQYHADAADELETFQRTTGKVVHHWQPAIDDYDETAALVAALDIIISVCTAIVHLGGALGRSVWVIVPSSPDWRYGLAGDRMPWYPSVRLFRQSRVGEWPDVMDSIRTALRYELQMDTAPESQATAGRVAIRR
jgi:tetratricopeptide (TPR) repeat protein